MKSLTMLPVILVIVGALSTSSCAGGFEASLGHTDPAWQVSIHYHPSAPREGSSPAANGFWARHVSGYFTFLWSKDVDYPNGRDYTGILDSTGFPGDEQTGDYDIFDSSFGGGLEFWISRPHPYERDSANLLSAGVILGFSIVNRSDWNEFYDPMHILDSSGYYKVLEDESREYGLEVGAAVALSPVVLRGTYDTVLGTRVSLGYVFNWG